MEELRLLIEMVANLPQMALWVAVGFFVYKVVVIGSIYGLIRFGISKLHDWLIQRKIKTVEIRPLLDGLTITGNLEQLMTQLHRIHQQGYVSGYIHRHHVDWLRQAIDDKIAKDKQ